MFTSPVNIRSRGVRTCDQTGGGVGDAAHNYRNQPVARASGFCFGGNNNDELKESLGSEFPSSGGGEDVKISSIRAGLRSKHGIY